MPGARRSKQQAAAAQLLKTARIYSADISKYTSPSHFCLTHFFSTPQSFAMSASSAPSPAIKITNLRRPFTEKALRSHLAEFGSYDFFWLSRIKDVCLLQYDSPVSAARAVPELHGRPWPEHGALRSQNSRFISFSMQPDSIGISLPCPFLSHMRAQVSR